MQTMPSQFMNGGYENDRRDLYEQAVEIRRNGCYVIENR